MNEQVHSRAPKPPRFSHLLAVALELGIVAVLIGHRAWEGLLLAAVYSWFSATWAMLFKRSDDE